MGYMRIQGSIRGETWRNLVLGRDRRVGRYWEEEEATGQLHDGIILHFHSPTVCCFLVQVRAIDPYNSQWD